jgi:hypothetical protein
VPGIRSIILLLVIVLSGAHVAGTQVYAWASMTVERAQTMPVLEALQSVVTGSSPCRICRAVDQLQMAQTPSAPQVNAGHLDLAPAAQVVWILPQPAVISRLFPTLASCLRAWTAEVPTPPPRGC